MGEKRKLIQDIVFVTNELTDSTDELVRSLLVKNEKGFLFTKRAIEPFQGQWHLPGGSILFGETIGDAVKRVAEDEYLLTKNTVTINDKKDKREAISKLIIQQPNRKIAGIPLRLHVYNMARPNKDSIFEAWLNKNPKRKERLTNTFSTKQVNKLKKTSVGFNDWLKKKGEEPEIISQSKTKKSLSLLEAYHINNGWFDVSTDYEITKNKTI